MPHDHDTLARPSAIPSGRTPAGSVTASALAATVALAALAATVALAALAGATVPADHVPSWGRPASETRLYAPLAWRRSAPTLAHPDERLAERIRRASQALQAARPPEDLFPAYRDPRPPTTALAAANVDAACHDFPDLPHVFGRGVHRRSCAFAVASYLGNHHALAARQEHGAADVAWARAYARLAADVAADFVYGPADAAQGAGYRDTFAAMWQNPLRAVDLVVLGEQLRQLDALDGALREDMVELLSGMARAWHAAFWLTGVQPSHGVTLTIRTPPDVTARSLMGRDVACRVPWAIAWNADQRNSPAEEVAWMGAGAMLAARALGSHLADAPELAAAGRHYVAFALAYDRPDPVHGSVVRTLCRGDESGVYGQRRYWLKNHAADAPAIPYLAATWHFIGTALMASPLGGQRPWPQLIPNDEQWAVMLLATEESLLAPDGRSLVDWGPGGGIGYALEPFPAWRTDCGASGDGLAYTRLAAGPGGAPLDLSEIGHPAGLDLLAGGWVVRRLAAARGDAATYRTWSRRLEAILDEYTRRPPDPAWARCKFAPYVSDNEAYHYARFLSAYSVAHLGASGFEVAEWPPTEERSP